MESCLRFIHFDTRSHSTLSLRLKIIVDCFTSIRRYPREFHFDWHTLRHFHFDIVLSDMVALRSFHFDLKNPRTFHFDWKTLRHFHFDSFPFRNCCTSIISLRVKVLLRCFTFDSKINIGLFTSIEKFHIDAFTSIKSQFLRNLHFDSFFAHRLFHFDSYFTSIYSNRLVSKWIGRSATWVEVKLSMCENAYINRSAYQPNC